MSHVLYFLIIYCLTQSDMLSHLFIDMHGWSIIIIDQLEMTLPMQQVNPLWFLAENGDTFFVWNSHLSLFLV